MAWRLKKKIQKINKTKTWLFEKINKIDEPLTRLIKKKREMTQVKKSKMKEVTTDTTKKQRIIRKYYNYMPANWTTWVKWINC